MRLAVIGDPNRKEKDEPLVKEGAEFFKSSEYYPITQIRFDLGKKATIRYNGIDLNSFDCMLPVPTFRFRELIYAALRILHNPALPFDAEKYLLSCNDELLFNYLNKNGIKTRQFLVVASNISLRRVENRIKFPVVVRPPNKMVVVTNAQTLKDVISLTKLGTPVRIERPARAERTVWTFVAGREVVASYEKIEKKSRIVSIDDELKNLALRVRELIGCDYCALRFSKQKGWVLDQLTFSPNFSEFQKITGKNVARYVVSHLIERAKETKGTWWDKTFGRWVRR